MSKTLGEKKLGEAQLAPGMLDEHYAPRKPLYLVPFSFSNQEATIEFLNDYPDLSKTAVVGMHEVPEYLRKRQPATIRILSTSNLIDEMARNLFSTLRDLDQMLKIESILIDLPIFPQQGLTAAIRDRLKRASRNKPVV